MAAARAAIETGDLAVAHRRIGEANGRLIGADKALPQLTATVEQLSVEIDDRREQQQRLLKFEQLARDAMDNMSYDMNLGGEKQAAQALDLYGVLSDDHWLDRLQASYLNKQQQSMVQQTAYETLLSLADFGVRWSKRSTEESTTVSLRYLEQAEAFHPPTRAFYWVRRECLKFLNKLEEAERDLKLFQSTAATTAFDYYLPGHTAGWGGDLKEAIRSYEAALRMQPDHFNSLFFLATRLDSGGRKAEAVQIWRACLALRPDHIPTLRNRALALSEQGEFEEALESVNKAIELKSNSAFAFQARASIYQAMQEYDKASADLDQAHELARDDQVLGVVYTRALGYARQGQYDAALADLSTVLEIAPKHERGHGVRGVALKSLGRFDEALAALNEAIKIDPQFANFYLERSQVYCGLKQYDHALPDIERAIELTTNPKPEIYQRRSSVHVGLKNYEQAVADMLKAIEIDPKYSIAYNNLAWLRITCPDPAYRDVSQAVDFATKAVELAPHNGDVWNTLGVAQYRASDLTTAVKSLTTSLEKKGDVESPESDFFLAMAHWRLGDHDEAREWYEKAVKIMTVNKSTDEELLRFRAEAEETLGIETAAPIPEKSDSQSSEAVISSEKNLPDVPPTNSDLP